MKKIVSVFLSFLIFLSIIFGFIGCAESVSNDGNTSGVTLNFNGTNLHGKNAKYLNSEDIAPYVGMPIQEALAEMDFGIDLLERNGFYFNGWTKTKNGEDYILHFPTFGTIYAKWVEMINVKFDLNGGYAEKYYEDITYDDYIIVSIPENAYFDSYVSFIPYRKGFTFIGWTLTKDGDDFVNQTNKDKPVVYAKWQDNLRIFDKGDIVGEFAPDGEVLTYEGEGIYTYEFLYSKSMNGWGSEEGSVAFKLRPKAGDWSISYGMHENSKLEVDGFELSIGKSSGEGSNINVYGLVEGLPYTVKVECSEYGDVTVEVYTGGDILYAGGNGELLLTFDAGKGCFIRESITEEHEKDLKKFAYSFTSGLTLGEIMSSLIYEIAESMHTEYHKELDLYYCYEEDGNYYTWYGELKDNDGNIIDINSIDIENIYLYTNTTYTIVYKKLVPITFNFNGGTYNYESSARIVLKEGESLDFDWINNIKNNDLIFMGWTESNEFEDNNYVTTAPNYPTTLYAKWGALLTIDAGKGTFVNVDTGEEYKLIKKFFKPNITLEEVWNDIYFSDSELGDIFGMENGKYHLKTLNNKGCNVYYKENDICYGLKDVIDDKGDVILDKYFNGVETDILLEKNINLYMQYERLYSVTHNLNGGVENGSSENISYYWYSGVLFQGITPTRDRCIFKGWTLTPDGEDYISSVNNDDVIVYAKWEANICALTIDAGENKGKFTDENGNKVRYSTYVFEPGDTLEDIYNAYAGFLIPSNYFDPEFGLFVGEHLPLIDSNRSEVDWSKPLYMDTTIYVQYELIQEYWKEDYNVYYFDINTTNFEGDLGLIFYVGNGNQSYDIHVEKECKIICFNRYENVDMEISTDNIPDGITRILLLSSETSAPNLFAWDEANGKPIMDWPGQQMLSVKQN